ncbi:MAG: helix-turn-helix transcriptional regulator [Promethearchaeota archaeon]
MWLNKFLDLEDSIEELRDDLEKEFFKNFGKKTKLTPLEFTILETIFNSHALSGYDLIQNLNRHFAGTWEAKSGTVYPILSKLQKHGFLDSKMVKSPIGPIRKVYTLTEAGEELLKLKVNKNFADQLKFVENFLIELSSVYIRSYPKEDRKEIVDNIHKTLNDSFINIIKNIPPTLEYKMVCPACGSIIERQAAFCAHCGSNLLSKGKT